MAGYRDGGPRESHAGFPARRAPARCRTSACVAGSTMGLALVAVVVVTLKPFASRPGGLRRHDQHLALRTAPRCAAWSRPGRTRGALRRSWLLFGTTMAMWTVADLLWYAYGTADGFHSVLSTRRRALPARADPRLARTGPLSRRHLGAGRPDPPAPRHRRARRRAAAGQRDGGAGRGRRPRRRSTGTRSRYVVYPVTDVLLAGLAVLLLLRSSGRPRPDLLLIAAAFATWTAADNGLRPALGARPGLHGHGGRRCLRRSAPVLLGLAALTAVGSAAGSPHAAPRRLRHARPVAARPDRPGRARDSAS